MKKSKSKTRNNSKVNRQYYINKISNAMNLKYSNFFSAAKYDLKSLKEDIGKLLSTQYCSKDPREVFKPIESNILEIVKKKNPQLQAKVKKARKLPEIKYSKDKYQEADELEKGRSLEKTKELEKNNSKAKIKGKSKAESQKKIINKNIFNKKDIKTSKTIADDNNRLQLTEIVNANKNKKNKDKEKEKENDLNETEEVNNTMYRLQQEYGTKHTLVDRLKNRIKYDPTIKQMDEDKKLYEKEQEELKQKKILEQQNYLNDLKIQIEEKDKRRKEERQRELKEIEEIQKQVIKEREEIKQKELDEKEKREKIKKHYEKLLEEQKIIKRQQKLEEDKENKLLAELINEEIKNEKKNIIEKKNKMKEEILKTKEFNEKLYKEKMNIEKQNQKLNEPEDITKPNSISNNIIKERIIKRAKEQEAAGNYLRKIINSIDKKNNDALIAEQEREKQEQKKKLEYEIADKNRRLKLEDYKKGLMDTLVMKNLEKEKEKEEEAKYRKNLEEQYILYLKEEKEKKQKQIEKYENYRKALEEQIKENKLRDFEKMKYI